ncbi:MAG: hypothetical protein IJP17_08155 [Clostridia bacterium]|nr:hypothetical protein [Clostridia bacterium]
MNIILGIAICIAAVILKFKYRPQGSDASQLFFISVGAGVVTMLTVNSFSGFGSFVALVLELALSALILLAYRTEARRQYAIRRERSMAKSRAMARAAEFAAAMSAPRSRTSVVALTEHFGDLAA